MRGRPRDDYRDNRKTDRRRRYSRERGHSLSPEREARWSRQRRGSQERDRPYRRGTRRGWTDEKKKSLDSNFEFQFIQIHQEIERDDDERVIVRDFKENRERMRSASQEEKESIKHIVLNPTDVPKDDRYFTHDDRYESQGGRRFPMRRRSRILSTPAKWSHDMFDKVYGEETTPPPEEGQDDTNRGFRSVIGKIEMFSTFGNPNKKTCSNQESSTTEQSEEKNVNTLSLKQEKR